MPGTVAGVVVGGGDGAGDGAGDGDGVAAPVDVARLRAETPGVAGVVHLNNAGSALPPEPVLAAQVAHLRREAEVGGYEAAAEAAEQVEDLKAGVAELLRARPDQVAYAESATRAWHAAFYAVDLHEGDRILTGRAEYASGALPFLQVAARTGAVVEVVPDDEHGQLDVAALADRLDERVRLVALTHVPTNGGLVNPAAEVGDVLARSGSDALYLLDACQSAGQIDLDVGTLGCDLLSATGRKYLRGPRGTGFLYVSDRALERLEPSVVDLHSGEWVAPDRFEWAPDARRFEVWESSVAGRVGLAVAVRHALQVGLPAIEGRVAALAERARTALAEVPGVVVRDKGRVRCGIVTFTVDGVAAASVAALLRDEPERPINTSVAVPSSTRWDAADRGLPELVRASVHAYNTEEEVDRLVAEVDRVSRRAR